jgi:hypothetical protein
MMGSNGGALIAWRNHRGTYFALLAVVTLTACSAHWQPVTLVQPSSLDSRTVLEFQAKNQLVRLHGVEFKRDSLSGIPWLEHLNCDTCRVRYALSDISQARTGNPGAGAWLVAGPMLFVGFVGALILLNPLRLQ